MCAKNLQILPPASTKSGILKSFAYLLIVCALYPQKSSQQVTTDNFSTIKATCFYEYESNNIYTCRLPLISSIYPTDVLEIGGTHLANFTDADVQAVCIVSSTIVYFNGEVLRKFENLMEITFEEIYVNVINPNAFEVCSQLEKLDIKYGQLTTLPSQMFKNCENLRILSISANEITSIPEDLFGMTRNLEEFIMTDNELTSLPAKLLQNMENLRFFDVGSNYLTELSPNLLVNAVNLEKVGVYFNQFKDLQKFADALDGHTNLNSLWIHENSFSTFDFGFFAQFQKLESLSVGSYSGPNWTNISWQSLPSSLIDLTVYEIGEEILENSFNHLVNLNSLLLSGLGIENPHKDTFHALTKLDSLTIQYTNIKTLHSELFTSQINLGELILSGNQIEELPAGIFAPLVNIGIKVGIYGLQITETKLRRLNANSFGQHPHLRTINFSFNKINEIERGIFNRFPNLTYVRFNSNNCISKELYGENIGENEDLELCYNNWDGIFPTATTTLTITEASATTSASSEAITKTTTEALLISPNGCGKYSHEINFGVKTLKILKFL